MLLSPLEFTPQANAHVRRITLQILRHAASCPEGVRHAADKLADSGWDWSKLDRLDAETIYGEVTPEVVQAAVDEFVADTTSVVDLHRNFEAGPQFHRFPEDPDGKETFCPLCGHRHIRWGFALRNTSGDEAGRDHFTGSDCIIKYGLRVDGESTAEAALAKLRGAIAGLQGQADREDWQAAHPDHVADMATVRVGYLAITKKTKNTSPWYYTMNRAVKRHLPRPWGETSKRAHKGLAQTARAVLKAYDSKGCMSDLRTAQVYDEGLLVEMTRIVALLEDIREQHAIATTDWDAFIQAHPHITPYETGWLNKYRRELRSEADLLWPGKQMIAEIRARHAVAAPPPTRRRRGAVIVAPVDDLSDIPFAII